MREGYHIGRPAFGSNNDGGGAVLMRLTDVGSAFPVNTYTLQRVTGYDSSLAWPDCFVTDEKDVTGINTTEFTTSFPDVIGEGVQVADSSGFVATSFGGSDASECKVRPPKVGICVWARIFKDKNDDTKKALFAGFERSAQQD